MDISSIGNSIYNASACVLNGGKTLASNAWASVPAGKTVISAASQLLYSKYTHVTVLGAFTLAAFGKTVQAYNDYYRNNVKAEVKFQAEVEYQAEVLELPEIEEVKDENGNVTTPFQAKVEAKAEIEAKKEVQAQEATDKRSFKKLATATWKPALVTVAFAVITAARILY